MERFVFDIRRRLLTEGLAPSNHRQVVSQVSRLCYIPTRSRPQSTAAIRGQTVDQRRLIDHGTTRTNDGRLSGLRRLPTSTLFRSFVLGKLFTTPFLFEPAFWVLRRIAGSHSKLLNVDRNPILRVLIKPLIYDQFCAGRNETEVAKTREKIKSIGYSGVILCYGREVVVDASSSLLSAGKSDRKADIDIAEWREGNLKTLDMIGEGDWLGIK